MKVLHVAESFGGGVATAMAEYVRSTPDLEHHLLYGERSQVAEDSWEPYLTHEPLGARLDALRTIRRRVRELQPDVVHAQSSFAGAYVRLALRNGPTRIVYTPHCFAFERKDISPLMQRGYRVMERVLALNTEVVAGCSPHEAEVARRWRGPEHAVYVPNIARVGEVTPAERTSERPVVVGLGRLEIQKDPEWFKALAGRLGQEADLLWVGGGSPEAEQGMRDAGIEVTGWAARPVAMSRLAAADCFVMTSLWEGFPMAILEASALGVPTVLRTLDAMPDVPDVLTVDTHAEAIALVHEVLSDPAAREHNLTTWQEYLADNRPEVQRDRLLAAYGATSTN